MTDGINERSIVGLTDFGRLSGIVHEAGTVTETVEAVADFALQCLDCTAAAILLGPSPSRLAVAATTDEGIVALAESGTAGPIMDAFDSLTAVIIADTSTESRWPGWPAVDRHRLHSLLVVRLKIDSRPAGLLLAGHTEPNAFAGEDDEAIAHIIARHASIAVAGARQQATLAQAVDARKLVGQAMGILMERYDLSDDQAFAVLRRCSQITNTRLRTVAVELINTRELPGLARTLSSG